MTFQTALETAHKDVMIMADNGFSECASTRTSRGCSTQEQVVIMFTVLNHLKGGKISNSISGVINYPKMYSWTPRGGHHNPVTEAERATPAHHISRELALRVLGGDKTLLKYNKGQTYYCKKGVIYDGKMTTCNWHANDSDLCFMGKMALSDASEGFVQHYTQHDYWSSKSGFCQKQARFEIEEVK